MSDFTDTLAHFGVKGMKWGRRKADTGPGPDASSDAKKAFEAKQKLGKKGNPEKLSNQELQVLVNRMNLERQLSTLTQQSAPTNAGAKFARDLIVNVGRQQATKLASDLVSKQIAGAMRG